MDKKIKNIEKSRQFWIKVAKDNDWYKKPFFVQVWLDNEDNIIDSVSFIGIEEDIIIITEEEGYNNE